MTATETKSRPIIFTGESVLGILDGTKTQSRRIIPDKWWRCLSPDEEEDRESALRESPFQVGARLWVKEKWSPWNEVATCRTGIFYRADALKREDARAGKLWTMALGSKPRSPLYMPRWASRLTLEITGVKVERVQDISEADAIAEGCKSREQFRERWHKINGAKSWDANCWVWRISFRKVQA